MSKTRKANKVVSKKKVGKYTAEDCNKVISALASKNQASGMHYENVRARLAELNCVKV